MGDLIVVLVVAAFFTLAALFVRWCDRLIGPDDLSGSRREPAEAETDR